jgi:hypothetical protein
VTATDINHYGLHTVTMGFGNDHTSAIVDYRRFDRKGKGIVEKNANASEIVTGITTALYEHGLELKAMRFIRKGKIVHPQLWLIDGGYQHDTVQSFVAKGARKIGLNTMVIRGFAAKHYNPNGKGRIGDPRERCHEGESTLGSFIAADVDYWRENFQRGFLGVFGAPGGCTFCKGDHNEFAIHVLNERLTDKVKAKDGSIMYNWNTRPNAWHDYLDAGVYCVVAAAYLGIGTIRVAVKRKKKIVRV